MYNTNLNIEAVQKIDTIIQTPKSTYQAENRSASSFSTPQNIVPGDLPAVVEEAARALEAVSTELTFRVHEGTGRPLIQLVELGTNNVIREIPPEKMLDILAGIWEWAGLIVDRRE